VAGVTVSPVGELLLLGGGSGTGAGQWVPCPSGAALVPILKRWQFGDGPALGSILLHALAGTARSMPSFDDDARRRVVRSTSEIVRAERPASAALADALETLEGVLATDAKLGHDQLAQAVSVAAIGAAGRAAARIDELARDLSGVLTDLPDGDVLVVGDLGLSSFPSSVALASLRIAAGARRFWVAEGGGSRFGSRLTAPPLFGAGFTVTVMLDVDIARLVAGGRTALVVFQGEGKSPSGETYAALGSLAGASTAAHSGVPVFPWMPFDVPAVSADDPVLQPVIPGSGMFGADPEIKWPLDCVPANLISSTP
jgi:methylthioribose-1-phosphate isomerase